MIANSQRTEVERIGAMRIGNVVAGVPQVIGEGFNALHFSQSMFGTGMDPLLMVDHFVMTAPTFDPHLHSGMSAVTAMFEDSVGNFLNRDTLGNNVALKAGDLYWLAAASGAAHEEKPDDGARTHALQVFVDLPERLKAAPARAVHVKAADVPIAEGDGYRVRVVLGQTGDIIGAGGTPEEMTLLDGRLSEDGRFSHVLREGRQAWIYAVTGLMAVSLSGETRELREGNATTIGAGLADTIVFEAREPTHFVLMAAKPVRTASAGHGPALLVTQADGGRQAATPAERLLRLPA